MSNILNFLYTENNKEVRNIRNAYNISYPKANKGYVWTLTENEGKKIITNVPGKLYWGHPLTRAFNRAFKGLYKKSQLKQVFFQSNDNKEVLYSQLYNLDRIIGKPFLDYSYLNNLTLKNFIFITQINPKEKKHTRIINIINLGSMLYRPHLGGFGLYVIFDKEHQKLPLRDNSSIRFESLIKESGKLNFKVSGYSGISWDIVDNYFLGNLNLRSKPKTFGDLEIVEKNIVKGEHRLTGKGIEISEFENFWQTFTIIFPKLKNLEYKTGNADLIFRVPGEKQITLNNIPYISLIINNIVFPLYIPSFGFLTFKPPLSSTNVYNKFNLSGRFIANRTYNRAVKYKNSFYQEEINKIKGIYAEAYRNLKNKILQPGLFKSLNEKLKKSLISGISKLNTNIKVNPKEIENFVNKLIEDIRNLRYEPTKVLSEQKLFEFKDIEKKDVVIEDIIEVKEIMKKIECITKEEVMEFNIIEDKEILKRIKEINILNENFWDYITDDVRNQELYEELNRIAKKYLGKTIEDDPEWQYLSEELTDKLREVLQEIEKFLNIKVQNPNIISTFKGFKDTETIIKFISGNIAKNLGRKQGLFIKREKIKNFLLGYTSGYILHLLRFKLANALKKAIDKETIDYQNLYSLIIKRIYVDVNKQIYGHMLNIINLALQNALLEVSGRYIQKLGYLYITTQNKLRNKDLIKTASPIFKAQVKKGKDGYYVDSRIMVPEVIRVNLINVI